MEFTIDSVVPITHYEVGGVLKNPSNPSLGIAPMAPANGSKNLESTLVITLPGAEGALKVVETRKNVPAALWKPTRPSKDAKNKDAAVLKDALSGFKIVRGKDIVSPKTKEYNKDQLGINLDEFDGVIHWAAANPYGNTGGIQSTTLVDPERKSADLCESFEDFVGFDASELASSAEMEDYISLLTIPKTT